MILPSDQDLTRADKLSATKVQPRAMNLRSTMSRARMMCLTMMLLK